MVKQNIKVWSIYWYMIWKQLTSTVDKILIIRHQDLYKKITHATYSKKVRYFFCKLFLLLTVTHSCTVCILLWWQIRTKLHFIILHFSDTKQLLFFRVRKIIVLNIKQWPICVSTSSKNTFSSSINRTNFLFDFFFFFFLYFAKKKVLLKLGNQTKHIVKKL